MSNGSAETKAYNKAQVLDILRKHPGESLTSGKISKLLEERGVNVAPNTVKGYGRDLVREYPELTASAGRGYTWAKEESEFYAKKAAKKAETSSTHRKKNTVMRNSEGYSDPTAGVAIRNTEGDDPYARLGEIWSVRGANGLVEWFLILSDWKAVKVGVPLYAGDYRSRIPVKVDVAGTTLYGDATNIRSKPSKYFDTYMGNADVKVARRILNDVLTAICDPDISPTVIEAVIPANTITVNGTLYTEADIRSKIDTIDILQSDLEATEKECEERREEVKCAVEDLAKSNAKIKELDDVINGLRNALATARKNTPVTVQVDGEIYNEEDIAAIIRARNTVRVGDKVYMASDIIALEEGNYIAADSDESFVSDMTVDVNYLIQQNAEYKIYKQFFEAYCAGLAKGVCE